MTRGQIAIITPDGRLITSAEFNGDMYYDGEGHGKEVVEALESVETEEEYREFVNDFNDRNFRYTDFIRWKFCRKKEQIRFQRTETE